MLDQEKFLNTPLGDDAATLLNKLHTTTGAVFVGAGNTVRDAIHGLQRIGLDARDTVSILIHAGVFDPFLDWVTTIADEQEAKLDAVLETHVDAIVQPLISTEATVDQVSTGVVCVDCNGENGPSIYRFDPTREESRGRDDEGLCLQDYNAFMLDPERTNDECDALNASLLPITEPVSV